MVSGSGGFSLIELLMVAGAIAILAGIIIPVSSNMIARRELDSSSIVATTTITAARNRAIAERRNFEVTFVPPNRITVERIEVPGPGKTMVEDVIFLNELTYEHFTGMADTPDRFGPGVAAIQFTGTAPVMFTSDGSLIDANGDVVNGTIFLGRTSLPESARAITIFGVTGLITNWKWMGTQWVE